MLITSPLHPQAVAAVRAATWRRLLGRRVGLEYALTAGVPWRLYTLARVLDAARRAGVRP